MAQYNTTYKLWWKFCHANKYLVFNSSVKQVIEFLQILLETSSCKFGSFNSHRSALSLILMDNIAENQILKRFLKGIANLRPAAPRYTTTWDTEPLLNYLEILFPLETLSLQTLASKLATLLLLITGHRIQTIHSICVENIIETPVGFQILIKSRHKTSRFSSNQPCLQVPYFKDNSALCVASLLHFYINKTKNFRKQNQGNLFLISRPPYATASKATISRWVKQTMQKSGIDTTVFKPQSTRHASTSKALLNGISLDIIRKTAGWSDSSSTFAKFYNRPIVNPAEFAKSIFCSVKNV